MNKSIYAVYWRWYDGQGKEILPRTCVTHSWHSSYRKAKAAFDKQKEILYGNYPKRKVEHDPVRHGWSTDDGTYELEAAKVFAKPGESSHIRIVLAATNLK